MKHKKVSIVIPLYNSAPFIDNTLKAVFESTYPHFEVILIDDGSTDKTREVLEKNGWMSRVTYIYQENGGISSARNKGILTAEGYYISLLDHDDFPLPGKLDELVDYLEEHPEYSMVYTPVIIEGNHYDPGRSSNKKWILKYEGDMFQTLFYRNHISPSSTLFIKTTMIESGLFDVSYKISEEHEFFMRYSLKYQIGYLNKPLTKYSWRYDNTSVKWKDIICDYEIKLIEQYRDEIISRYPDGRRIFNKSIANAYRHKAKISEKNRDYSSAVRYLKMSFNHEKFRTKTISRLIRNIILEKIKK